MTSEERQISELSPLRQRRMAMLALAGYRFEYRAAPYWGVFFAGDDAPFGLLFRDTLPAMIDRCWKDWGHTIAAPKGSLRW